MADREIVPQERPDVGVDLVDLAGEVGLDLRQLPLPGPARHLHHAVVLAARHVGKGPTAPDILERGAEATCEVGVDVAVMPWRRWSG